MVHSIASLAVRLLQVVGRDAFAGTRHTEHFVITGLGGLGSFPRKLAQTVNGPADADRGIQKYWIIAVCPYKLTGAHIEDA